MPYFRETSSARCHPTLRAIDRALYPRRGEACPEPAEGSAMRTLTCRLRALLPPELPHGCSIQSTKVRKKAVSQIQLISLFRKSISQSLSPLGRRPSSFEPPASSLRPLVLADAGEG